jgi:hypothetical protein
MSETSNKPVPYADKRRSVRCGCKLQAAVVHDERILFKPACPVNVVNISEDGIALHVADEMPVWTVLTIKLYNSQKKSLPPMSVRIVRTARQSNGTWVLGAMFLQPISSRLLQFLIT